jgi:hypothetical protein
MTSSAISNRYIRKMAQPRSYRARCYRNLNKPGVTWSIVNSSTGLVDQYANKVILKDVSFKISKAGQLRVRKEKRKNVHAFVIGNIVTDIPYNIKLFRATYNPYRDDGFHLIDGSTTLTSARYAVLCEEGLFVVL